MVILYISWSDDVSTFSQQLPNIVIVWHPLSILLWHARWWRRKQTPRNIKQSGKVPQTVLYIVPEKPWGEWIIRYLRFTIYNLHYCNIVTTFLSFWKPYEPLSYALSFFCSMYLLFLSTRSRACDLFVSPKQCWIRVSRALGSDCFFFDNNELERILWSFDAQSSI